MAQVTNQSELISALDARDPFIQFAADFSVDSQINVSYPVTFESVSTDSVCVLSKDASYYSYLIRVFSGGELTVRNLSIDGNKELHSIENTANRSLINVSGGTLTLGIGSIVRNNHAYLEGGGVYLSGNVSYPSTVVMEDNAQIRGCISRTSGGGMIAALRNNGDRVEIRGNALFAENTAANGGGLYYRSYQQGVGVPLTIGDEVSFLNNTATANGGGIYVSGYTGGGSTAMPFALGNAARVQGNQANNGGGIYYYGASDGDGITISGGVISENIATTNGGGVNVTSVSGSLEVSLTDSTVEANQGGSGGGIFINSAVGCLFSLRSLAVRNNRSSDGSGGGIWFGTTTTSSNPFTADINALTLSDNASAHHGGGLYFQSASSQLSLVMENCDVTNNSATMSGGGLLFNASGSSRVSNSRITGNTSGQSGGGYYFNTNQGIDSTVSMTDVTVSENTAAVSGGGLRLGTGGGTLSTLLTDSVIEENRSVSSGGGIWNGGANANLTVNGNSSILKNATEVGNGGGIYFNSSSGGTLLLEGETKIRYNTADTTFSASGNNGGGVSVVPGMLTIRGNTEISNNSALKAGGGISLAETTSADLEGKAIFDNSTSGFGGGVSNTGGSRVRINGMRIYGNQAAVGGGIHNRKGGIVTVVQNSVVGGETPNTATLYAPGIYNASIFETADEPDIANGLYLTNREAAAQILRPMANAAVIQLDLSDYVTPNAQGTPIVVADGTADYPILSSQDAETFQKPSDNFDGWEIRLSDDGTQVWLSPVRYSVAYENLMGATQANPAFYLVTSPSITLRDPSPLLGYRFIGWYDANGTRVNEIPSGSMGDLTFYARWEMVYRTIRYFSNAEGAENLPDPIQVVDGDSAVLSDRIPTRSGFRFMSWNTAPNGTGEGYRPSEVIASVTSDLELYAQWKVQPPSVQHKLTYYGNDESGSSAEGIPDPVAVESGQIIKISDAVPTRDGFRFTGWNTRSNGTGVGYLPGETVGSVSSDIDLYAQWVFIRSECGTLVYKSNADCDSSVCCIPPSMPLCSGIIEQISCIVPTRRRHCFVGWNTKPDGSGVWYFPGESIVGAQTDLVLYAVWQLMTA